MDFNRWVNCHVEPTSVQSGPYQQCSNTRRRRPRRLRREWWHAGPCVITYDEPLFSIATARDVQSDAPIGQVVLRGFIYDRPPGPRPSITFLTDHFGLTPTNVTTTATELVCTVRCAFGAGEGAYTFTFGAAGYRDTVVTLVDVKFSRGSGSCPRAVSGGTALDLRLTRQ